MKLGVGATMQHPGPSQVYMSKAPGSVKEYDGSGGWFKILQENQCSEGDIKSTSWCSWDKDRITFTIPKDTPDGEILFVPSILVCMALMTAKPSSTTRESITLPLNTQKTDSSSPIALRSKSLAAASASQVLS